MNATTDEATNPIDLSGWIDEWPVTRAAAIVVDASGRAVAAAGATGEVFALASVTKPLVAWAVLIAAEEGSLSLEGAASGAPEGATVADLLAHSSGLGPEAGDPVVAPRTRRVYSNAGFELLGDLLTGSTGMTMAEYLTEAVTWPLGMSDTRLEGSPGHGGWSTAQDLARFLAEAMSPRLIHPDTAAATFRPHLPGLVGVLPGYGRQAPNPWGLGWEVRGSKHPHWTGAHNSPGTVGHFGRAGGFLWIDHAAGLGTVVLTDEPFGPWALPRWPAFSDAVLERFGRN